MDFEKVFAEIQADQKKLQKREQAVRTIQTGLGSKIKALIAAIRPSWLMAVRKYNGTKLLRIVPDDMEPYFDFESKTLSLKIRLRSADGREPDEEFYHDEVETITSVLKPILDKKFLEADIPLTLGHLSVPHHYYMK